MIPYEYLADGEGLLTAWATDARERRSIKSHIWLVVRYEHVMAQDAIYFPVDDQERRPGIYYAKIRSSRQLRPRLCLGPQSPGDELTYLARAVERDDKITPPNATDVAFRRRHEVAADPARRQRITVGRTQRI